MGPVVKQARERVRLSQKQLADSVEVSQSVVSLWETGMALPPPDLLNDLARVLKVDVDMLMAARQRTEARNASAPRSIDYILYQADEFLRGHSVTIWVCGPEQLPVLENRATQEKWLDNLAEGVSYNLLWVLDRVQPAVFKAALRHFAQIADEAREMREMLDAADDMPEQSYEAPVNWGRICFHAITASERSDDATTIETYSGFCEAVSNEDGIGGLLELLPYVPTVDQAGDTPALKRQRRQLREAIDELLLIWHPETSMILYQPASVRTPPIANIRLMQVSEEIHTLGGALERPMYWLSQLGAAHFSHVIETISGALKVLQPRATPIDGDRT